MDTSVLNNRCYIVVLLQRHSATYADPHQCTNNYGYHDYQDPGAFRSGSITPTIPGDETRLIKITCIFLIIPFLGLI